MKIEVVRCHECAYYKATRTDRGIALDYRCCHTNGYSPDRMHFCAWGEQSFIPEGYRYQTGGVK